MRCSDKAYGACACGAGGSRGWRETGGASGIDRRDVDGRAGASIHLRRRLSGEQSRVQGVVALRRGVAYDARASGQRMAAEARAHRRSGVHRRSMAGAGAIGRGWPMRDGRSRDAETIGRSPATRGKSESAKANAQSRQKKKSLKNVSDSVWIPASAIHDPRPPARICRATGARVDGRDQGPGRAGCSCSVQGSMDHAAHDRAR